MSFQWLQLRIAEEQERREREAQIRERLPRALDELHGAVLGCIESYQNAFGPESADLQMEASRIRIVVREEQNGQWSQISQVDISAVVAIPGFQIDTGGGPPLVIEVGMLPGDKLFFRDREKDQYVSMEEVTHRALDRAFFPKLRA